MDESPLTVFTAFSDTSEEALIRTSLVGGHPRVGRVLRYHVIRVGLVHKGIAVHCAHHLDGVVQILLGLADLCLVSIWTGFATYQLIPVDVAIHLCTFCKIHHVSFAERLLGLLHRDVLRTQVGQLGLLLPVNIRFRGLLGSLTGLLPRVGIVSQLSKFLRTKVSRLCGCPFVVLALAASCLLNHAVLVQRGDVTRPAPVSRDSMARLLSSLALGRGQTRVGKSSHKMGDSLLLDLARSEIEHLPVLDGAGYLIRESGFEGSVWPLGLRQLARTQGLAQVEGIDVAHQRLSHWLDWALC